MIYKQKVGPASTARILVDMDTGAQYLETVSGGLTPLLDRSGKPLLCTICTDAPGRGMMK